MAPMVGSSGVRSQAVDFVFVFFGGKDNFAINCTTLIINYIIKTDA
jgi:hypothetical protein